MSNRPQAVSRKLSDPDFMQALARRSFMIQAVMAVAIVGLVADRIWIGHHPPQPQFFYTDGHGTPYEVTPLDVPVMSDAEVLTWTVQSIVAAYSVNFATYRDTLSKAASHFSNEGWNNFGSDFIKTGNLDQIKRARLTVTAQPERAATILDRPVVDSRYSYKIQFPMIVTYMNENQKITQHLMVDAVVMRSLVTSHPDGMVIDRINTTPISASAGG